MANPQKEKGFVAIANDIMEALAKTSINNQPRRVLDFILRKTYGFNKKRDAISLSQFSVGTGLKESHVCRSINTLKTMNIIIIIKEQGCITKYEFQKDYDKWKVQINDGKDSLTGDSLTGDSLTGDSLTGDSLTGEGGTPSRGNQGLPHRGDTKDTLTKDTLTKDIKPSGNRKNRVADPRVKQVIDHFFDQCQKLRGFKPAINGGQDGKKVQAALKIMTVEEIFQCVDFFIPSKKADELGCTLSIALSAHTLNLFRQGEGQNVKSRFERIFGVRDKRPSVVGIVHREKAE